MATRTGRSPLSGCLLNRRHLLARTTLGALAFAGPWAPPPVSADHLSRSQPASSGKSWLLVIPDAPETGNADGNAVAVFGQNGEELARFDLKNILGRNTIPTGDPRHVVASTWDGNLRLLHLDRGKTQNIDIRLAADTSVYVVDPRGTYGSAHPGWSLAIADGDPTASDRVSQLVLLNLDRASGVDLWPQVADGRDSVPQEYRFSGSGRYLAIWDDMESALTIAGFDPDFELKGRAWLVPTEDPATARPLDGGKSGWISTAAEFSPDERFLAYCGFDPDTLLGNIFLEPVAGGETMELAKGNAWSRVLWIPGETRRLLSVGHGEVKLHQIDDSGSVTSTILAYCAPLADQNLGLDASGVHAVVGAKSDGPVGWKWCDLISGDVRHLTELDGLDAYSTSGINTWPRWRMFGPGFPGFAPIVGLDLETGETFQVIELAARPDEIATSADGRVAVLGTTWEDTHPARLVDLASRTATPLRTDRTHMIRSGIVSPDGSRAAVHQVANRDHALDVLLLDTSDPATMQPLSTGAAVVWTAENSAP